MPYVVRRGGTYLSLKDQSHLSVQDFLNPHYAADRLLTRLTTRGTRAAHIAEDMGYIWNYDFRGFTLGHQRNSRKAAPAAATAENWLLPAERLGFFAGNFAYLLEYQQIPRNSMLF